MLGYRSPPIPPPVTPAERAAVLSGYLLLTGGLLALPWLLNWPSQGKWPMWLAMAAAALGAAITAYCYITNALRRW